MKRGISVLDHFDIKILRFCQGLAETIWFKSKPFATFVTNYLIRNKGKRLSSLLWPWRIARLILFYWFEKLIKNSEKLSLNAIVHQEKNLGINNMAFSYSAALFRLGRITKLFNFGVIWFFPRIACILLPLIVSDHIAATWIPLIYRTSLFWYWWSSQINCWIWFIWNALEMKAVI